MPKKKLTLHQKAVARSQRISELHKQSKDKPLEENAVQTNENEQSSKCKLRDVKNNKKKNDKKELSKLLFAKEVPENPQNPRKMDPLPVEKNNASNEENQEGYNFVKPAVKKEENVMKIPNNNGMNKLNNAANKNPTPKPPGNEEKHVINLPTIFESEANVPKGRMNYQDLLNTSSTSYFQYILDPAFIDQFVENSIAFQNTSNININTNAVHNETTQRVQNTGVSSNSAETNDCIKIMEILCKYITENEMKKKYGHAMKNNIFSPSEMKQIKYIEEQLLKLSETSQHLEQTREKLTRLIQFHETKQLKKLNKDNSEEIIVKCDNGSVYKIKESDVIDTIKKMKAREGELVLIEEAVKNELTKIINTLPNALKTKLLETADANPVKNTEKLKQVHENNTTNCINTKNNDSPLKLTRKQKKNKKKKIARKMRCHKNKTLASETNETELDNISNATFDLAERNLNETLEIGSVEPEDSKETPVIQTNPVTSSIDFETSFKINASSNENHSMEKNIRMNLNADEIEFLAHIVNNRINYNVDQRENYIKKYIAFANNEKNLFKPTQNGLENRCRSVIRFVNSNFPCIENYEMKINTEGKFNCDVNDSKDDENDEETEEIIIREVDPKVQAQMNKYETMFFNINITAIKHLVPKDPLNKQQYEEYDENRKELNQKFADLFEMNYITLQT